MKGEVLKIGQEIEITEDFKLESCLGTKVLEVKKGDRAYIDGNGFMHYTTGKARGMIQKIDAEIKGFDYENISKIIFKRLGNSYNLDEYLDDYDFSRSEFIEEIENTLVEIL
ncbi:hypothetical protein [Clostridium sp.]|uniref:hypothetical protein n=1 Tax=Clostridium sp. TaxID=1506 RepID=UPI0032178A32